jgi:hypothetical protein
MIILNLYEDDKGTSHFRELDVDWSEQLYTLRTTKRIPVKSLFFVESPADYDLDWHTAPRKQYIINLDAAVQITAGDGESREIGIGQVILVEDTNGQGHLSKVIGNKIRHAAFIAVE